MCVRSLAPEEWGLRDRVARELLNNVSLRRAGMEINEGLLDNWKVIALLGENGTKPIGIVIVYFCLLCKFVTRDAMCVVSLLTYVNCTTRNPSLPPPRCLQASPKEKEGLLMSQAQSSSFAQPLTSRKASLQLRLISSVCHPGRDGETKARARNKT